MKKRNKKNCKGKINIYTRENTIENYLLIIRIFKTLIKKYKQFNTKDTTLGVNRAFEKTNRALCKVNKL